MKTKHLFICVFCFFLCGCSLESKMKKKLAKTAERECPNYKFINIEIIDTVFYYDLKDTIQNLTYQIEHVKKNILKDSTLIAEYRKAQDDCKNKMIEMPYYLYSSMNSIIESYNKLIDSRNGKIKDQQIIINQITHHIQEVDSIMGSNIAENDIVFYITNHKYDCGGGEINENVYFNKELNIYKTEYHED